MSQIQQYKINILQKIKEFQKLDLSKIYTNNPVYSQWNSLTGDEIKPYVNYVVTILNQLEENIDMLDVFPIGTLPTLESYIQNTISAYNNQGIPNIPSEQISSQHHDFLNNLQNVFGLLWNTPYGSVTQKSLASTYKILSSTINKIQPELDKFLLNQNKFKLASESAETWLENKRKIEEEVIKDQARAYENRAKSHKLCEEEKFELKNLLFWKLGGTWSWLFMAFIFAGLTYYITHSFVTLSTDTAANIGVGQAILRIASIIVPAYMTVFSASQFLYHKKMYEAYMFKSASLGTMNYLLGIHGSDTVKAEKILTKGLDVLFSEPSIKDEGGKVDKQIVSELLGMLKSQLK